MPWRVPPEAAAARARSALLPSPSGEGLGGAISGSTSHVEPRGSDIVVIGGEGAGLGRGCLPPHPTCITSSASYILYIEPSRARPARRDAVRRNETQGFHSEKRPAGPPHAVRVRPPIHSGISINRGPRPSPGAGWGVAVAVAVAVPLDLGFSQRP